MVGKCFIILVQDQSSSSLLELKIIQRAKIARVDAPAYLCFGRLYSFSTRFSCDMAQETEACPWLQVTEQEVGDIKENKQLAPVDYTNNLIVIILRIFSTKMPLPSSVRTKTIR